MNLVTNSKENIVHAAVRSQNIDVISALFCRLTPRSESLLYTRNTLGYTPLAESLLYTRNTLGYTPLALATSLCDVEFVNRLLSIAYHSRGSNDLRNYNTNEFLVATYNCMSRLNYKQDQEIDAFLSKWPYSGCMISVVINWLRRISKAFAITNKHFEVNTFSNFISRHKNSLIYIKEEKCAVQLANCLINKFGKVDFILEKGVNEYTALTYSVLCGSMTMSRYFIDMGFDPSCVFADNQSLFHLAIESGWSEMLIVLFEKTSLREIRKKCPSCDPLVELLVCPSVWLIFRILNKVGGEDFLYENGDTILHRIARRKCKMYIIRKKGHLCDEYFDSTDEFVDIISVINNILPDLLEKKNDLGNNPLFELICYGKLYAAKKLINIGVDTTTRCSLGRTILHAAVLSSRADIAEFVYNLYPEYLNIPDSEGDTPLMLAVRLKGTYLKVTKFLLSKKECDAMPALDLAVEIENTAMANILVECKPELLEVTRGKGVSAIVRALINGNQEQLKTLLKMNYGIDSFEECGENILNIAIQHNNTEAFVEILKHCPTKLYESDKNGTSPYECAVQSGRIDIADVIFDHFDQPKKPSNKSIIYDAVRSKSLPMLQWALKHYPSLVNEVTSDNTTPVMLSLNEGFLKGTVLLLDHGAELLGNEAVLIYNRRVDLTVKTIQGRTIIHAAVEMKNVEILSKLLKQCPEMVNEADNEGIIPLAMTESINDFQIAKLLIGHGGDIKWKSQSSETLLHQSIIANNRQLLRYILDVYSESITSETDDGSTPLHYCIKKRREELLLLLLSKLNENKTKINNLKSLVLSLIELAMEQNELEMMKIMLTFDFVKIDVRVLITRAITLKSELVFHYLMRTNNYDQFSINERKKFMFSAIRYGTYNMVMHFVKYKAVHSCVDDDGNTILHAAINRQCLHIVQLVITKARNLLSSRNREGETPVILSAVQSDLKILNYILEQSDLHDVLQHTNDDSTIIHAAVTSLHCENLKTILKFLKCRYRRYGDTAFKIKLDHRNKLHDSAIFDAVRLGQTSMLNVLIEEGADYLMEGSEKGTILHASIISRQLDTVKCVLASVKTLGNDGLTLKFVNQCAAEKVTALYNAVECGCLDIAKLLMEECASLDVKTSSGSTLLHAAVKSKTLDMVEFIYSKSKHLLNCPNEKNEPPLFKAVAFNFVKCLEFFGSVGVELLHKRSDGSTILHLAIINESVEMIKTIKKICNARKSDLFMKLLHMSSNNMISPVMLAVQTNNMEITKYLFEQGTKPDQVSNDEQGAKPDQVSNDEQGTKPDQVSNDEQGAKPDQVSNDEQGAKLDQVSNDEQGAKPDQVSNDEQGAKPDQVSNDEQGAKPDQVSNDEQGAKPDQVSNDEQGAKLDQVSNDEQGAKLDQVSNDEQGAKLDQVSNDEQGAKPDQVSNDEQGAKLDQVSNDEQGAKPDQVSNDEQGAKLDQVSNDEQGAKLDQVSNDEQGAKLDQVSNDGLTLLNFAVQSNDVNMLKYIMSLNGICWDANSSLIPFRKGRGVNILIGYGYSFLAQSFILRLFDMAEYLEKNYFDLQSWRNEFKRNMLHEAVISGSIKMINYVINTAPELLIKRDMYGFKPIHLSFERREGQGRKREIKKKELSVFSLLFKRDQNLTIHNTMHDIKRVLTCIKEEKENEDDDEEEEAEEEEEEEIYCPCPGSLLHASVKHGNIEICQLILETLPNCGIDINQLDHNGMTPLFLATTISNLSLVDMLLKFGANPNIPSLKRYPLEVAIENNNNLVARALIINGANMEILISPELV